MNYFSLDRRVSEAGGIEPAALIRFYSLITQTPIGRAAYRRIVEGVLTQRVAQGRVLDLGTGPGYVAVEVARREPRLRLVGLDLAAHMVGQARHLARRAGLDGRALWPQADGHRLPFAERSFQLVLSSFALHHWREPRRVLSEIARVLAPGGRYYIVDLCREVSLAQRMFAYATIPALSVAFGSYAGYGGYYESVRAGYTRVEARAMLDESGLPPGEVTLGATGPVPIIIMASRTNGNTEVSDSRHDRGLES